jgi:hypothetical protein
MEYKTNLGLDQLIWWIQSSMFNGVPHFELGSKVTVSSFNELFIADLAFLAMLIGMNNSSGSHCLMCLKKGSEFNCNHNQGITGVLP